MPSSSAEPEQPLRIVQTIASGRWTGASEPMAHLSRSLRDAGHEVLCGISLLKGLVDELEGMGLRVDRSIDFAGKSYGPNVLRCIVKLRRIVLATQPDVLHCHMTRDHMMAGAVMRLLPRDKRPVLVRSVHREIRLRRDPMTTFLQTTPTHGFTAPSESQRAHIAERWRVDPSRLLVWRAEVDTTRFFPDPEAGRRFREKFEIPQDAVVFGLVSRLRESRGISWLIEAAEEALARNPKLWVAIAGRGPSKKPMRAMIARSAHADRLRHLGYLSGEDLEGGYNAFDCGLLMKPGSDGACRGAVQAMACGKPVIAGDVGSLRDLFGDGKAGWTVPLDDRAALTEALLAAAADEEGRRTRGERAAEVARTRHAVGSQAAAFSEFYRRLGAGRQAGRGLDPSS